MPGKGKYKKLTHDDASVTPNPGAIDPATSASLETVHADNLTPNMPIRVFIPAPPDAGVNLMYAVDGWSDSAGVLHYANGSNNGYQVVGPGGPGGSPPPLGAEGLAFGVGYTGDYGVSIYYVIYDSVSGSYSWSLAGQTTFTVA